jgi:meiotically up-regulated gene 157 (Mug157) protein
MYAAGALSRLRTLNAAVWQSNELDARAAALVEAISMGIARHGVVMAPDGAKVYAYEVDGLGHALLDFDDPNLPSLLAMPLLGFQDYDPHVSTAAQGCWGPGSTR